MNDERVEIGNECVDKTDKRVMINIRIIKKFIPGIRKEVSILDSYRGQFTKNNIGHFNVIGFTDNSGTQKYNIELSIKRAGEIARLIQSRFGIGVSLIK